MLLYVVSTFNNPKRYVNAIKQSFINNKNYDYYYYYYSYYYYYYKCNYHYYHYYHMNNNKNFQIHRQTDISPWPNTRVRRVRRCRCVFMLSSLPCQ